MIKTQLGQIPLTSQAEQVLRQVEKVMVVKNYAHRSIENYLRELKFLFAYYRDLEPRELTTQHVIDYLYFLIRQHQASRVKCRMVAHACSFYFRRIRKCPYYIPSEIYPRKSYTLPQILPVDAIQKLFDACTDLRLKCILSLLYGSGLRKSEVLQLQIKHIQFEDRSIFVKCGKGNKDRVVVLPRKAIPLIRKHIRKNKPVKYLFESTYASKPISDTALRMQLYQLSEAAGLVIRVTPKIFRHSCATHMLDQGTSILAIQKLMGHARLKTTLIYLHLVSDYRQHVVSPLDRLKKIAVKKMSIPKGSNFTQ